MMMRTICIILSCLVAVALATLLWGCASIGADGQPCTAGEAITHPERCGTCEQRTAFLHNAECKVPCERELGPGTMYLLDGHECVCSQPADGAGRAKRMRQALVDLCPELGN